MTDYDCSATTWAVTLGPLVPELLAILGVPTMQAAVPIVENAGERLHVLMEQAMAKAGLDLPPHPDDVDHNRAVGAAASLLLGSRPEQGVSYYNRWARSAGYPAASLVSLAPLRIDLSPDIVGMVAEEQHGELVILTCGPWTHPDYGRLAEHLFPMSGTVSSKHPHD